MMKAKMIEKESDFISQCQHQLPVCMVVFDQNLNNNQRLLCPSCLAEFESNKKMIGIAKVIKMIEENQNKKLFRIQNNLHSNFDQVRQLQESLIMLQTFTQDKLQMLVESIEKWLQTILELYFFAELEILIQNESFIKEQPYINSDIQVITESYFGQIAQNLQLFEQFKYFQQCSEILVKMSCLFEQQGMKMSNQFQSIQEIQLFRKEGDKKLNQIKDDELNHYNKEINESIEQLQQKYDVIQKNQKELHKNLQELKQNMSDLEINQSQLKFNLQQLQQSEKQLQDSEIEQQLDQLQNNQNILMILIKQEQLQNQINQISKEYNDRNILNIGGMCVGYLKEVIKKLQNLSIKAKELLQIQQEISNIQREIQLIELKKSYNQLLHNQQQLLNNKDQLITNSRQVQVFAEHLFQQLNQTDAEVIQLIQQLSQLTIKKNKTS